MVPCPGVLCCYMCRWQAGMREFNSLWAVRVVLLLTAAVLMVRSGPSSLAAQRPRACPAASSSRLSPALALSKL